ncbi:hypothetical protein AGR1B_Lc50465 [Agrobacterium fabacearum S56]|nr:hypothetical protein AGR1B_Lc50465 [Agrobacterium fabacearum S56]
MAFTYARGRGGIHARRILQGFSGVLQVDGYAGYNRLIAPGRVGPDIRLAYGWAHARRKLVEITRNGSAPIAEDGVKRIGVLYRIEGELRGLDPEARLAGRVEGIHFDAVLLLMASQHALLDDVVRFLHGCAALKPI